MKNLYEILGVPQDASDEVLNTAAIALAQKYQTNPTPENKIKFDEVEMAFEVLGSPELRKKYDEKLYEELSRVEETTTCRYCGEEILLTAIKCKHCGTDLVEKNKKKGSVSWTTPLEKNELIRIIIPVAIFAVIYVWNYGGTKNEPIDLDASARGACMEIIKLNLHDPSSAEFFHSSEANVSRKPDGAWLVTRSVRAKNAFNATRLTKFECEMSYAGGKWTAIDIRELN